MACDGATVTAGRGFDPDPPDGDIACPAGAECRANGGAAGHTFCVDDGGAGGGIHSPCGALACGGGRRCDAPCTSHGACAHGIATIPPPDPPA